MNDAVAMRRALLALLLIGCGDKNSTSPDAPPPVDADANVDAPPLPPDAPEVAPIFRNTVSLPDDQLALKALQLLGAPVPNAAQNSCRECHALTRSQLRTWRALSDAAMTNCFTDLEVTSASSARTMMDCLRAMPNVPTSDFQPKKLGIYSTATHLEWMQFTAKKAYGATEGPMAANELVATAGMPRTNGGAVALSQNQFDIVAEWFARGLPMLDQMLPQDPAPTTCEASVSGEVATHVAKMKTDGWRAVNKSNMMAMHGCGAATDPRQCLTTYPYGEDQPFGTKWDVPGRGRIRVLANVGYHSSYWTRSSPDGRFIAHGVQEVSGSYIIDLQRDGFLIPIDTQYDPNWFPDNAGFIFQGTSRNTCAQSVLTSNPTAIATGQEAGCASIGQVGLYQHVGRALQGDHFAIDSGFVSDDGGHGTTTRDPWAHFGPQSSMGFTPMVFDGTRFTPKPEVHVASPYEGDSVLSPSAQLVMSRVAGPSDGQLGFILRKVNATPSGGSYTIDAPEVARYCVNGGKPGFSYDERWVAYHHYVGPSDAVEMGFTGPSDPGFAQYLQRGAANIYLLELATGVSRRITNMQPGQYALFPHFRSDGWIYADVRDAGANREYMIASDGALVLEQ